VEGVMARNIMIVTGEASGDMYGSLLACEIKRIAPDVSLSGVGGEAMRDEGVEILLDSGEISVVGIWEALVRLAKLRDALERIKREIAARHPDLLILIDYPGMNLRLAKFAKSIGVRVMYYISPQVWAWGRGRIKAIRRNVDKLVVILPFEVELYRREGVNATYVGHPLIDIVKTGLGREAFLEETGLAGSRKIVSLLPGSRREEIRQHLGPLLETASLLKKSDPEVGFVLVTLPAFEAMVRREIARSGVDVSVTTKYRYEAMAYSDLAITCSGTVTLEVALVGTPMIVIYRLAAFSWTLCRLIVKVPYIALVNLVAREMIVPEFIQAEVKAERLAREAARLLADEGRRRAMADKLAQVKSRLGPGGATGRAAQAALELISK